RSTFLSLDAMWDASRSFCVVGVMSAWMTPTERRSGRAITTRPADRALEGRGVRFGTVRGGAVAPGAAVGTGRRPGTGRRGWHGALTWHGAPTHRSLDFRTMTSTLRPLDVLLVRHAEPMP